MWSDYLVYLQVLSLVLYLQVVYLVHGSLNLFRHAIMSKVNISMHFIAEYSTVCICL